MVLGEAGLDVSSASSRAAGSSRRTIRTTAPTGSGSGARAGAPTSTCARQPRRLSGPQRLLAGADVERRRRLDQRLRRDLAALPALRLPQGHRARPAPDWPITYEDLAPYYERADRLIGVSGLAGDPAMPPHDDYPTPPLAAAARPRAGSPRPSTGSAGTGGRSRPASSRRTTTAGRPATAAASATAARAAR